MQIKLKTAAGLIVCATASAAFAQPAIATTGTATTGTATTGTTAAGTTTGTTLGSADSARATEKLLKAAQDLRDAVQAMAAQPAGEQRSQAMARARTALLETQMAMIALPPEARSDGGTQPFDLDYGRSLEQLQQAAEQLREGIRSLARQSAGPDRLEAIQQANEALLETQQAMAMFNAALATRPLPASTSPTSGGGGADSKGAGK